MELFEAIYTRRSIRRYSQKKIENNLVDKIIYAGMYAPSAVNKQPWHFIIFDSKDTRKAIVKIHRNASMLKDADKAILVCYDEKLQHDEGYGVIDCSAAVQNMLLAAHALEIGACWIGIYPRKERIEHLKKIFKLPEYIVPFALISLGYPAESKSTPDRIKLDRIRREHW
jgi:nitroreductase